MPPTASADKLLAEARAALRDGRPDAARARIDRASALKLEPRHAETLFTLGNELAASNEPVSAIEAFERALQLAPGNPSVLVNLGLQLDAVGERARAERCYRDVLATRPREIAALANLSYLLFSQERYGEALEVYDRLVENAPAAPAEVWNNRGVCQRAMHDSIGAEQSFRRALEKDGDSPQVLANLGFLLYERMRYDDARPLLRRAHELDPKRLQVAAQLLELDMHFADWHDLDRRRTLLIEGVRALGAADRDGKQSVPPFSFLAFCDDPSLQRIAAMSFAWPQSAAAGVQVAATGAPSDRLRIGFVSAAFKEHPETRLLIGLLEKLDRRRLDVYAYALERETATLMRDRVARSVRGFREVEGMSADAIAKQIRGDSIEVLFDLTGHTAHSRPDVFAARPASIQINFLGYAGTLGAPYYDYIVTDGYTTPASEQPHFVERFLPLEGCYVPSDPDRVIGPLRARSDFGLPSDAFVWMSQAAPYKITPEMFDLWSRLLGAIDQSVLWLRPMRGETTANLRKEARRRGIAEERLIFAPHDPVAQYLARYRLADLYLDTFPFGSHTTVNDALFAGLPVLTLAGRSMASRASASQAIAAELPEMVVGSEQAYYDLALSLARDRARLDALTARLRTSPGKLPLFDMVSYARRFEDALFRVSRERRGKD